MGADGYCYGCGEVKTLSDGMQIYHLYRSEKSENNVGPERCVYGLLELAHQIIGI